MERDRFLFSLISRRIKVWRMPRRISVIVVAVVVEETARTSLVADNERRRYPVIFIARYPYTCAHNVNTSIIHSKSGGPFSVPPALRGFRETANRLCSGVLSFLWSFAAATVTAAANPLPRRREGRRAGARSFLVSPSLVVRVRLSRVSPTSSRLDATAVMRERVRRALPRAHALRGTRLACEDWIGGPLGTSHVLPLSNLLIDIYWLY